MAASVLTFVAEGEGLWDLYGPYGGQPVFQKVWDSQGEVDLAEKK